MRLVAAQITNFRCVDDSTEFSLSDVTCMVGKNESGKTTVLQALLGFAPHDSDNFEYDKTRDYPRKNLSDYADLHGESDPRVLLTKWDLDGSDVAAVEELLGPGSLKASTVEVSKGFGRSDRTWVVQVSEQKVIKFLLERSGCDDDDQRILAALHSTGAIHSNLSARVDGLSVPLQALKTSIEQFRAHNVVNAAQDILTKRMPKFLYFTNYDRMDGDVSIEQIKQNIQKGMLKPGEKVFLAFLEFAGTSLDELSAITRFEDLRARVESASIKITRQIFQYWSQNRHLKVNFTIDAARSGDAAPFNSGTVMRARIYNQLHDMTVPFGDRSAGFIWFFSFLVLFSQVKKEHGNVIILLDEPGLNLHAKAQGDLLRYIKEKLRPNHQVIYTTHSPFMVPPDDLASVRTVEDVVRIRGPMDYESLGTKVGDKVLSTDRDTLFPLQGALGYEITQSLFVGEHTLLVEGPSDILYMQAASAELEARGRKGLDRRWTPCPSNGMDKVQAFLSLFGGNRLHVAVLLDIANGQKAQIDKIKQNKLLRDGHVLTISEFCGKAEADVEDLFDPAVYAAILNGTYGFVGTTKLSADSLSNTLAGGTDRLVKKAEIAVNSLLPVGAAEFSHYSPSMYLLQTPQLLKGQGTGVEVTLDRFASLFEALNKLLPSVQSTRNAA
jgi:predicted ATP-dependent endonuclease of OLD family